MGLKSFHDKEKDELKTLPNAMSGIRIVGGAALGFFLAKQNITPVEAVATTVVLGMTDAEGNVITMFDKHARLHYLREKLRVFPSKFGRTLDPIADKALAIGAFTGALIGDYVTPAEALPVLGAELITSGAGIWAAAQDVDPKVSKVGKIGLVARGFALMTSVMAHDTAGSAQQAFEIGAYASIGTAVVAGVASAIDLVRQGRAQQD